MRKKITVLAAATATVAALVLFVVFIAEPATMGTTWSDRRRVDKLADDEIFVQLDQRWGAMNEVGVRPASTNFGQPTRGSVSQRYDAGMDVEPRHELGAVASMLEVAGWTTLLAGCPDSPSEFWTISAFRSDGYGFVTIDVLLIPPEASVTSSPDGGWIAQASIDVGPAAEAGEFGPPGAEPGLSCIR